MNTNNVHFKEVSQGKKIELCRVCLKRPFFQVIFSKGESIMCCSDRHCVEKAKKGKVKSSKN